MLRTISTLGSFRADVQAVFASGNRETKALSTNIDSLRELCGLVEAERKLSIVKERPSVLSQRLESRWKGGSTGQATHITAPCSGEIQVVF
jgi:hypothetical protein